MMKKEAQFLDILNVYFGHLSCVVTPENCQLFFMKMQADGILFETCP